LGGDTGIEDGEEVLTFREEESDEDDSKDEGKQAKPSRDNGARAEEKGESKDEVAGNVNDEDLAEKGGLIGLPAGWSVEKIKVESGGEDGDLKKIEKANGVDAGGVVVGTGKEDHENGCGPNEEENV
jgi:hypothetical protein